MEDEQQPRKTGGKRNASWKIKEEEARVKDVNDAKRLKGTAQPDSEVSADEGAVSDAEQEFITKSKARKRGGDTVVGTKQKPTKRRAGKGAAASRAGDDPLETSNRPTSWNRSTSGIQCAEEVKRVCHCLHTLQPLDADNLDMKDIRALVDKDRLLLSAKDIEVCQRRMGEYHRAAKALAEELDEDISEFPATVLNFRGEDGVFTRFDQYVGKLVVPISYMHYPVYKQMELAAGGGGLCETMRRKVVMFRRIIKFIQDLLSGGDSKEIVRSPDGATDSSLAESPGILIIDSAVVVKNQNFAGHGEIPRLFYRFMEPAKRLFLQLVSETSAQPMIASKAVAHHWTDGKATEPILSASCLPPSQELVDSGLRATAQQVPIIGGGADSSALVIDHLSSVMSLSVATTTLSLIVHTFMKGQSQAVCDVAQRVLVDLGSKVEVRKVLKNIQSGSEEGATPSDLARLLGALQVDSEETKRLIQQHLSNNRISKSLIMLLLVLSGKQNCQRVHMESLVTHAQLLDALLHENSGNRQLEVWDFRDTAGGYTQCTLGRMLRTASMLRYKTGTSIHAAMEQLASNMSCRVGGLHGASYENVADLELRLRDAHQLLLSQRCMTTTGGGVDMDACPDYQEACVLTAAEVAST